MMDHHNPAIEPLEAQLAAWGAAQALSPARAAHLRLAILARVELASTPVEEHVGPLAPDWWLALGQRICSTLSMAAAPRPAPVLPTPALP
jgi:hypothetical protein